jgi:FKBP-type peptidyl-prolyl cis-trans isomerase FkpA
MSMKRRIAALSLVAAVSAMLGLSACGGGSDGGSPSTPAAQVYDAPALTKTDTLVGTGAEVTAGKMVRATYTLWLYDSTKSDFKGTKIQGPATSDFSLTGVIAGWSQGIPGMRVGGKRTLVVPASLGYGANPPSGSGIPVNSGLVFDVEILATN